MWPLGDFKMVFSTCIAIDIISAQHMGYYNFFEVLNRLFLYLSSKGLIKCPNFVKKKFENPIKGTLNVSCSYAPAASCVYFRISVTSETFSEYL